MNNLYDILILILRFKIESFSWVLEETYIETRVKVKRVGLYLC